MQFSPDCLYHVYNRGNDKQKIFFQEKNYYFFLNKLKQDLPKLCDILAYCLMPNHFHLLIYVPDTSEGLNFIPNQNQQILVRKSGTLLSSYSQAINKQEGGHIHLFKTIIKDESTICNIVMARELPEIPAMRDQFYKESYLVLDQDLIKNVY
jgi:putative transposase